MKLVSVPKYLARRLTVWWTAVFLIAVLASFPISAQTVVSSGVVGGESETLQELHALVAKKQVELAQRQREVSLLKDELSELRTQLSNVRASQKSPEKIGISMLMAGTITTALGVVVVWSDKKYPGKMHRYIQSAGLQAIALGVLTNAAAGGTLYVSIKKIDEVETLVSITEYGIWLREAKVTQLEADLSALERSLR